MEKNLENYNKARFDHRVICDLVKEGSRVLDLGCGNGNLMKLLEDEKNATTQGIELSEEAIYKCVEKGLSVFHGDIDGGLIEYPDQSFDYVILNQSMQEIKNAGYVINEALRVGKKVVIGFPNFANLQGRSRMFFRGKTPITKALPYRWYDTPNLHFLTISDFTNFCEKKKIRVLDRRFLGTKRVVKFWPNMFASNAIFVITDKI